MSHELAIVMPVYNEEGAICAVLTKWVKMLDGLQIDYEIHAYNDGSKDRSSDMLHAFSSTHARVIVHDKKNSGHGPTILQGYREQAANAPWIFQIDSDDEMGPESFSSLWEQRQNYDFLIGIRDGRLQPLARKVISMVSRLAINLFYGRSVWDVNSPYRLMRVEAFKQVFSLIPSNTFAPNVILSGCVAKLKLRHFEYRVPHGDRKTGEVSIKKWRLFKASVRSFVQTIRFSFVALR